MWRNGYALEFAHPSLRVDHTIVMAAVERRGAAFQFAEWEPHVAPLAIASPLPLAQVSSVGGRLRVLRAPSSVIDAQGAPQKYEIHAQTKPRGAL